MNWTNDRVEELKRLQSLLNDVSLLNRGSHVCERIQRCEALANELMSGDINTGRKSFTQFLIEIACEDRKKV